MLRLYGSHFLIILLGILLRHLIPISMNVCLMSRHGFPLHSDADHKKS